MHAGLAVLDSHRHVDLQGQVGQGQPRAHRFEEQIGLLAAAYRGVAAEQGPEQTHNIVRGK